MDAFSYLSVLLSIIIGLAMTQVLQGYRGLLLARGRVRLFSPPLIWSAVILLSCAQSWWASYGYARHDNWDFGSFCIILLQFIFLYLMSGLVLPDFPGDAPIDLRDHYFRERVPFFGTVIGMLLCSVTKDWWIDGHLPEPGNLAFHVSLGAIAALAMVIGRPLYHRIVAPLTLAGVMIYIVMLFARLAG